eukprot:866997-Pleurochrysis_carterae.AAC.5
MRGGGAIVDTNAYEKDQGGWEINVEQQPNGAIVRWCCNLPCLSAEGECECLAKCELGGGVRKGAPVEER